MTDRLRYAQSWALSMSGHGAIIALAFLFLSSLQPTAPPEPFRWDVALVATPASEASAPAPEAVSDSAPAAHAARPQPPSRQERVPAPAQPVHTDVATVPQPEPTHEPVKTAAPEPPTQQPFPSFDAIPTAPAPSADTLKPPTVIARQAPALETMAPPASAMPQHAEAAPAAKPASIVPGDKKVDLSWLPGLLLSRLQKPTYPAQARLNGWEGRVVVRMVIHEDGTITDVAVNASSGYSVLDEAAVKSVQALSPLPLPHALPGAKSVSLPMIYHLD